MCTHTHIYTYEVLKLVAFENDYFALIVGLLSAFFVYKNKHTHIYIRYDLIKLSNTHGMFVYVCDTSFVRAHFLFIHGAYLRALYRMALICRRFMNLLTELV